MERRARALEQLTTETWDVLVVGGGIVGCAAALEAALRGAKVALIEQDDIASGTSSRTTKLIHGGLRYVPKLHVGLVSEALRERAALLRLAPHLVRLERFLLPVHGDRREVALVGASVTLYGALGAARDGGWPRYVRADRANKHAPALRGTGLRGAFVYADGVVDDARLNIAVARTAERAGALIVTRIQAGPLDGLADDPVPVCDVLDGSRLSVRTRVIVDATGATRPDANVLPSRGSHIVIERQRIPSRHGLTLRVRGRLIFVVPWDRHWIIGTTDVEEDFTTPRPLPRAAEVTYLIDHVNSVLDVGLTTDDILATFAGIRPLAVRAGRRGETVDASREHVVKRRGRVVTVRGGKYTTFRRIGRAVIDAALGRRRDHRDGDMRPLVGALLPAQQSAVAVAAQRRYGLPPEAARRLVERYGSEALDVASLAADAALLEALDRHARYLEGELAWGIRHEWALSLDDLLSRRMRLVFESRDHGVQVAERVGAIAGHVLGWNQARRAAEVAAFTAAARREYGVPTAYG